MISFEICIDQVPIPLLEEKNFSRLFFFLVGVRGGKFVLDLFISGGVVVKGSCEPPPKNTYSPTFFPFKDFIGNAEKVLGATSLECIYRERELSSGEMYLYIFSAFRE